MCKKSTQLEFLRRIVYFVSYSPLSEGVKADI